MVNHSRPPDRTTLPAQHFRSSSLLCRRSDGLELATRQSPRPGAQQQQLQTIAEDEPISSLPLSTHSAVEMPHDSALYKSIIGVDIDKIPQDGIPPGQYVTWLLHCYLRRLFAVFIARHHTDARYLYSNSVCPSVCASVCP